MAELSKVKVTILKITINQDIVDEYLEVGPDYGPCDRFQVGQEFVIVNPFELPEGFCSWAWADIRNTILNIAAGADKPWLKKRNTEIVGCSDWYRPVYFKVEQVD